MSTKTFRGDIEYFTDLLRKNKPFALTRFGDGELIIVRNKKIDLTRKCMGEYKFVPGDKEDDKLRQMLMDSFTYQDEDYWKGIVCPCCGNKRIFQEMSQYAKSNLTWANVLVNANYSFTKATIFPLLSKNHEILLICNNKAKTKINKLPFKISKTFFVGTNAWKNDFSLVEILKRFLRGKKNWIVLVCAGPFSNILVYNAWIDQPKTNTLINAGSILDPYFFGRTRGYHRPLSKTANKVCIWGDQ